MKKIIFLWALSVISSFTLCEAKENLLLNSPSNVQIVVNNRILAKVNGKAISVMDVVKKMDLLFYRQFPEYATSSPAKFQFYQLNWKNVLGEIIDKELLLADAQESKIVVSSGDVRQEMENLFGPNIIANLDKIELSFDEAAKMILADITIRRMMYFRVQMKAINQITPQQIRTYYETIAKDNIRDNEWIYHVVTIRHKDANKGAEIANLAHRLLIEDHISLPNLTDKLTETFPVVSKQQLVTISEELVTKEKDLSDNFKKTLITLVPENYSLPVVQKNRTNQTSVFRIFYLKNMIAGGVVPFNELENKIKDKLINDVMEKETIAYFARLRQHFDVQESQLKEALSSDQQPFMLK